MSRLPRRLALAAVLLSVLHAPAPSRASEGWIELPMYLVPDRYPTLQAALDAACLPGTVPLERVRVGSPEALAVEGRIGAVVVRPGIYHEALRATCGRWAVSTHGAAATVIDGDGVRRPLTSEGGAALFHGFTFANGVADEGGAVALHGGSAVLSRVVLRDSRARVGGALYLGARTRTVVLEDAVLTDNAAAEDGGAIWMGFNADLRIERARLLRNAAGRSGGAIAMAEAWASLRADRVLLSRNVAAEDGGALHFAAVSPGTAYWTNALVADNEAARGGGIHVAPGIRTTWFHLTVAGNVAAAGAGLFAEPGAAHTLSTSLIWGNSTPPVLSVSSVASANSLIFTDVEGGVPPGFDCMFCYGNFSEDPRFANPAAGDYTLLAGSPAIDRAAAISWGTGGQDHDLDGDPRPGGMGLIDAGAYEHGIPRVTAPVSFDPPLAPACGGPRTLSAVFELPAGLAAATGEPSARIGELLPATVTGVRGDRLFAEFERDLLLGELRRAGGSGAQLELVATVPGSVHVGGTASLETIGGCAAVK